VWGANEAFADDMVKKSGEFAVKTVHLKQPQRKSNLQIRLEEYLPFGLEAGLIEAT